MIKKIKRLVDFFSPFIKKLNDDNIFAISGQSAFFLMLALVPFAMFVVSILQTLTGISGQRSPSMLMSLSMTMIHLMATTLS